MSIAAFDLGIKNLSYCVAEFDPSGHLMAVQRWANLNLLADGADSQSQTRCPCGGPASWQDRSTSGGGRLYCKKCAKKSAKPVLEKTGMKLADWRTWGVSALGLSDVEARRLTKAALEERAAAIRIMPYKAPKVGATSLQQILVGMETCLTAELPFLQKAARIRIENQPSEFAPQMKSVQIMLFTLLDHRLRTEFGWKGIIEFANASVKTRGAAIAAGKENKRARKLAGMAKVEEVLVAAGAESQLAWWRGQAKKDDLADALLMCLDAVVSKK